MRRLPRILAAAVLSAALPAAACGGQEDHARPAVHDVAPEGIVLSGGGTFGAPAPRAAVIAYDRALVPPGAWARVTAESGAVLSTAKVEAGGFLPGRTYGVHLHVNPCGADPDDAGPHYRDGRHSHAGAAGEVWLDFTTDRRGAATATAKQDWAFAPGRPPRSLVVHAEPTTTAGADAGSAGPRVACVTLTAR
ncbi:superoxide dismutase family protein [Planomonospora sp. ID82291]|uniref:superoxide dismutase family protein n=1 Tax=Planomonospora sp. ID82291 TaxID=2738136 RepID=UPI0018C40852|nr:superoxide dismutase family protein [Planomonospora sp. ID82291]MBG0815603.1 superoxide dismutase family protein [Planomonospora sp. ID82291]